MVVKTYTFVGKSANCDLTSSGHRWSPWQDSGCTPFSAVGRSALAKTHLFRLTGILNGWSDRIIIKTYHYIIFFVRPLHSKPRMESYCWSSTEGLSWWAYGAIISQVWPSCWLCEILIMVGYVLSQLKPSEVYILSCGKGLGLRPRPFSQLSM